MEKQLADKAKEHEDKLEAVEKEKVEMQDRYCEESYPTLICRHIKEVGTIQLKIQESDDKAKTDLDVQVGLMYCLC